MRIKALVEGILVAVVVLIASFGALISPVVRAALALRYKMPDAWFSGLIVFYADLAVLGVSAVLAGVAFRKVYKQVVRSTRPS